MLKRHSGEKLVVVKKAERDFRDGELRKEMRKMEKRHSDEKTQWRKDTFMKRHSGEKLVVVKRQKWILEREN